jgi:chorismate mutase/prephenate dehydratase
MKKQKTIRIGIIGGTGSMGVLFKRIFEENGQEVYIGSRSMEGSYKMAVESSGVVIISVPLHVVPETIKAIKPFVKKNQLIVNFSSLQSIYTTSLKSLPCTYIGIHPMFGPTVKNLYGQHIVFCHKTKHPLEKFLRSLFIKLGALVSDMNTSSHDEQMALTQALIHSLHITSALTKKNFGAVKSKISTPVSRLHNLLTGRIFSQSAELYENILMMNPKALDVIDEELKSLLSLRNLIVLKDRNKFQEIFNSIKDSIGEEEIKASVKLTNQMLSVSQAEIYDEHKVDSTNNKNVTLKKGERAAFLGPLGTYSHQATDLICKGKGTLIPKQSILDVFESVQKKESEYGIVPVENSTEGVVKDALHIFPLHDVSIVLEYALPIRHCLLSKSSSIKDIKIVQAHSQALGQCRGWLKKNLGSVALEATSSNVSAVNTLNVNDAIIASEQVAKMYNLNILAKDIADNTKNTTLFYLIKRNEIKKENKVSNTLAFDSKKKYIMLLEVIDRVGALKDILSIFSEFNLNLSRIVSMPSGKLGRYNFLVDVNHSGEGDIQRNEVYQKLEKYCSSIKLLGVI